MVRPRTRIVNIVTICIGMVFATILCLVAMNLTHGLATIGTVIMIAAWFVLGFSNIKTEHLGLVVFFGTLRVRLVFEEGPVWLPPLILGIKEIDARIGTTRIETPFVFTKDKIRVYFKIDVWTRIIDPYTFLSTKEEKVWDGIKGIIEEKVRLFAL